MAAEAENTTTTTEDLTRRRRQRETTCSCTDKTSKSRSAKRPGQRAKSPLRAYARIGDMAASIVQLDDISPSDVAHM